MGLFDIFRRPVPVRDAMGLADFIDQHAAFLAQKGIYEYARARAGHYAKVLFGEADFQAACDQARWRTYPIGLAVVGEIAAGLLEPAAREDRPARAEAIRALVLAVFDRHQVPGPLDEIEWRGCRNELDQRLRLIGLHPPKWAKDVPEPFWQAYFDLLPIHSKLKRADAHAVRSYLRVTAINIHDALTKRIDASAVTRSLLGRLDIPPRSMPVTAN